MDDSRKSLSTDDLKLAVAGCMARHAGPDQRMVVGLSGGVDSVVLLHAVLALGYSPGAVHVHHGLNPLADDWAEFCNALCANWGVGLVVKPVAVDRNSPDGLEGAARRARHSVFDQLQCDWLLLGHHQGDRAETVLFNLLRGAGVRGTGAMRERAGRFLRPMLAVARADVLAYAKAHSLTWVEDTSNRDERFSRNFLRHRILPDLTRRFPAAEARIANAAGHFAEATDLLDDLALLDLGSRPPAFPVDVELLASLSSARARNVLRFLLTVAGVGIASDDRLAEALRQCLTAAPDRHPRVAFGRAALFRKGNKVYLDSAARSDRA